MALTAERVTVGAAAVALNTAATSGTTLLIRNGAAAIDLGTPSVVSGAGFSVPASDVVTIEVDAGDVLFAICATTSDVEVLRT